MGNVHDFSAYEKHLQNLFLAGENSPRLYRNCTFPMDSKRHNTIELCAKCVCHIKTNYHHIGMYIPVWLSQFAQSVSSKPPFSTRLENNAALFLVMELMKYVVSSFDGESSVRGSWLR